MGQWTKNKICKHRIWSRHRSFVLENYRKILKNKTRFAKQPDFESGSRVREEKVLTSHVSVLRRYLQLNVQKYAIFSKHLFSQK